MSVIENFLDDNLPDMDETDMYIIPDDFSDQLDQMKCDLDKLLPGEDDIAHDDEQFPTNAMDYIDQIHSEPLTYRPNQPATSNEDQDQENPPTTTSPIDPELSQEPAPPDQFQPHPPIPEQSHHHQPLPEQSHHHQAPADESQHHPPLPQQLAIDDDNQEFYNAIAAAESQQETDEFIAPHPVTTADGSRPTMAHLGAGPTGAQFDAECKIVHDYENGTYQQYEDYQNYGGYEKLETGKSEQRKEEQYSETPHAYTRMKDLLKHDDDVKLEKFETEQHSFDQMYRSEATICGNRIKVYRIKDPLEGKPLPKAEQMPYYDGANGYVYQSKYKLQTPSVSDNSLASHSTVVDDWLEDLFCGETTYENEMNGTDEIEDFCEYGVMRPISFENMHCHKVEYSVAMKTAQVKRPKPNPPVPPAAQKRRKRDDDVESIATTVISTASVKAAKPKPQNIGVVSTKKSQKSSTIALKDARKSSIIQTTKIVSYDQHGGIYGDKVAISQSNLLTGGSQQVVTKKIIKTEKPKAQVIQTLPKVKREVVVKNGVAVLATTAKSSRAKAEGKTSRKKSSKKHHGVVGQVVQQQPKQVRLMEAITGLDENGRQVRILRPVQTTFIVKKAVKPQYQLIQPSSLLSTLHGDNNATYTLVDSNVGHTIQAAPQTTYMTNIVSQHSASNAGQTQLISFSPAAAGHSSGATQQVYWTVPSGAMAASEGTTYIQPATTALINAPSIGASITHAQTKALAETKTITFSTDHSSH